MLGEDTTEGDVLSVLLLATQDVMSGGAAKASERLHRAYLSGRVESCLRVAYKRSDLPTVVGPDGRFQSQMAGRVKAKVAQLITNACTADNAGLRSIARFSSGLINQLNDASVDVVHLHWVFNEFLSVEDIGKLTQPLVWTLHDMWPFLGAEHYAADAPTARWRSGYSSNNRPRNIRGFDLDKWVWQRKRRAWKSPIHIIAPSQWMADCVKSSALMHHWPVSVIPNVLDTEQFCPWPKALCRQILGLPAEKKLILFGAIGGGIVPRKGRDLLQAALRQLATQSSNFAGVIFGQSAPLVPIDAGLPLHWMGHIYDETTLALLYSAVDVVVVPSRQDNLPQTATEAQACGCPVVAFNVAGLPSAVVHQKTGYLARPFDVAELAAGILWVLESAERYESLAAAARDRAVKLWSPEVILRQHMALYRQVIESNSART